MRTVFLVFACLACAGQSRRVQTTSNSDEGSSDPYQALAALMQSSNPAAGFSSAALPTPAAATRAANPSMMARRGKKAAPKKKSTGIGADYARTLPGITIDTASLVGRSDAGWLSVFDPNGLGYFDPAGFTIGQKPATIRAYREAELKHGRISMLATLGFVITEKFHPLFGGTLDGPSLQLAKDPALLEQISVTGWAGIALVILGLEVSSALSVFSPDPDKAGSWGVPEDRAAGDLFAPFGFTFDPLGLKPKTPDEFKVMQTKELNNGRLAMLAILGMALQEAKTGTTLF